MIFIAVVLAVYLGMNWYVLARLYRLFALGRGGWFYVALLPLSLSGVAALALESRVGNVLTGSFSTVAMGWLGLCWLLLCLLLAQQALAWIVPLPRRVWGISWGTRPFLRCQGRILLSMQNARRIANLPSAVIPRGRSGRTSHAPSAWCHPVAALPRGTHPA